MSIDMLFEISELILVLVVVNKFRRLGRILVRSYGPFILNSNVDTKYSQNSHNAYCRLC